MMNIPSEVVVFVSLCLVAVASAVCGALALKSKTFIPNAVETLETRMGEDNWKKLIDAANMGIRAAQQARLTGLIENTGNAAKTYALEATKTFLASMGLEEIDVDAIDKIIEGLFNTVAGELKDQLIKAGLKV
jgi:hypothetical protein